MKLILMPGMDGTGILFRPIVCALEGRLETQVITYPTDEPLGYAELLPRVRSELPKTEPFVLLGESFSGPLALTLAAEEPAGLCGVILCASFAANPIAWLPRWVRPLVRPWMFRVAPRAAMARAVLGRYATAALRDLLYEANRAVSPRVMARRGREILGVDVTAQFQACRYPLLYLRGKHDRVVRKRVTTALSRARPEMPVAAVAAPHLVLQAAPDESARAICEFVAELRRQQRGQGTG